MRVSTVDLGLAAWKNTQNLEKWEFSDEEFVTRTRIVPKVKKRGRKRSSARQVEEVEEELQDIQEPLPKSLRTRWPKQDDWAQKNSETSITPSGGTLTNNGENVDSLPDWSDWSADREEIPLEKKPVDEETMQQIIEKLNAITARAARNKAAEAAQAAMEGGGLGHSSMSIDVGGSSHSGGFPVASQGSSKVPPAQPRKQTVPWAKKLQKSRLPPGRNLSQAHHHPRKRAKKTGDIQRGDNLIKATDQPQRVASIRRPSMAMTNPSEMSMDVDYDPIVSNTDEEDNLNDRIRSNGVQETIEMVTPTQQPPGAANLRNGGQRRANHGSHRAGETEQTEEDLDTIIEAGGQPAQRACFRKYRNDTIPVDGGWARELKEDDLRVSNKRRRQVQWGWIGRLKHIKAVNRVRKQRAKATTESHRNAIRHIEFMVMHVGYEGHLVTTLCDVISLPDGPGVDKIPPKVKVLVNSKGTVLGADNVAGTKLRVYEPWQVVELGEDLGVAVVSNFAEFFKVE
ncbi:hypothetical protein BSKO_10781 [Bryopsis sp. KO-2023]|nr:hypothetical protein BSKO_10781 [Bryopsis sp. KO-2023]